MKKLTSEISDYNDPPNLNSAQQRFPKSEYEAIVIGANPHDRYSFENGGNIVFKLDNDEIVTYHIKGFQNVKSDISLKTAGYYLNKHYVYGNKYFHRELLNRHCIVLIELFPSKKDSDKLVPVIVGFKFSYIDLFSYNGDNHAR